MSEFVFDKSEAMKARKREVAVVNNTMIMAFLFLVCTAIQIHGAGQAVIDIGSRLELFVDDYLIEKMTGGAELQLHHPLRREIALVTDNPWEGNAGTFASVFQDGDLYRMYYSGLHYTTGGKESEKLAKHPTFLCYAESKDGISWIKPKLGLVKFKGSKANNIVLDNASIPNAEICPVHTSVFKDTNPDCPLDARYKALTYSRDKIKGLFILKSADGIHFSLMAKNPVIISGDFDSLNLAFWDALSKEYREYHRGSASVRAIMTSTSKDFLKWGTPVFLKYPSGTPNRDLYTSQILPYYRAPHIFVGFPLRYLDRGWSKAMRALPQLEERTVRAGLSVRYGTTITDCLFMTSRDSLRFKRWGEAFIRPGPKRKGAWVYGDNCIAWGVVETESALADAPNELSIYATEEYWTGTSLNWRRFSLRMDGFVSVRAPLSGGEFVTRPFIFDGNKLTMNFETSAAGSVRVEIQNINGQPVAGYTLRDCPAIFGDAIDYTIHWKKGVDVSPLAGKPVRLRFVLSDADLYSIRFR